MSDDTTQPDEQQTDPTADQPVDDQIAGPAEEADPGDQDDASPVVASTD